MLFLFHIFTALVSGLDGVPGDHILTCPTKPALFKDLVHRTRGVKYINQAFPGAVAFFERWRNRGPSVEFYLNVVPTGKAAAVPPGLPPNLVCTILSVDLMQPDDLEAEPKFHPQHRDGPGVTSNHKDREGNTNRYAFFTTGYMKKANGDFERSDDGKKIKVTRRRTHFIVHFRPRALRADVGYERWEACETCAALYEQAIAAPPNSEADTDSDSE